MTEYPKISIVTPSFNDAKYLETTILSVIGQGYPNLEYIVIDGGSTDGSIEIIRKHEKKISYWVSERDHGMYFAVQKGFKKSTGEIMGWINSDDQHQPGSLFTIAQIFSDFNNIHWLQGTPTVIDEKGRIFTDAHRFEVDKFYFYNRSHSVSHKYIQQESTFWRRNLWVRAGEYISTNYKYAGDFELWMRFFQYEQLYHVNAVLGSFRQSASGQASFDHYEEYLNESYEIINNLPLSLSERRNLLIRNALEKVAGYFSRYLEVFKNKFSSKTIVSNALYFDPRAQKVKKW